MRMTIFSFILCIGLLLPSSLYSQPTLKEIIKEAESRLRGSSSVAVMTITIVRPKYTRDIKMKAWTAGNDYNVMYVMAPARDKGVVYLKRDREIWNYLPSVERNIKMPPSMMNQSWMGTDLSNDDLVQKTSLANDFEHEKLEDENISNIDCYHIKLIPKENAEVIWGRIDIWVDKVHFNVMKQEQFDEDIDLANTMIAFDVKKVGKKTIPTRMEFVPADKPQQKTVLVYNSIQFDTKVPDHFFTTQYMTRLKP
ncbi:MAG: outer membrane lipoprotein-sorting protein [Reichenbachiella sp.]